MSIATCRADVRAISLFKCRNCIPFVPMRSSIVVRGAVLAVGLLITALSVTWPLSLWRNPHFSFLQKLGLASGEVPVAVLTYQIRESGVHVDGIEEQMTRALRARVDPDGVLNLVFRPAGVGRIEIQMHVPGERHDEGLESVTDLKRLLRSGVLEFHILPSFNDSALEADGGMHGWVQRLQQRGPDIQPGDKYRWFEVEDSHHLEYLAVRFNNRKWVLTSIKPEESLDQSTGTWSLARVYPSKDPNSGQPIVWFEFDAAGAELFNKLTQRGVDRSLAIVLDGRIISAPNINTPITGGTCVISGGGKSGFTNREVSYLVSMLSVGSLPAQLDSVPVSERTQMLPMTVDAMRMRFVTCMIGLAVLVICAVVHLVLLPSRTHGRGRWMYATILVLAAVLGTSAAFAWKRSQAPPRTATAASSGIL